MAKTNITDPIWVTKIDRPDHDKAIQIDPGYALAYVNRGVAYYSYVSTSWQSWTTTRESS